MKFYYENNMCDEGEFEADDIVLAIYSAWNIEANLYIWKDSDWQIIFSPFESNELNSELLNEFELYMIDGNKEREIRDIKTNEVKKYEWEDVLILF